MNTRTISLKDLRGSKEYKSIPRGLNKSKLNKVELEKLIKTISRSNRLKGAPPTNVPVKRRRKKPYIRTRKITHPRSGSRSGSGSGLRSITKRSLCDRKAMCGTPNFKVASFDIGSRNFSFAIEEFDTNLITKLKTQFGKISGRYNNVGEPTPAFKDILTQIYLNGNIIQLEVVDLTNGGEYGLFESRVLVAMNEFLDKYITFFDECDIVIIEQQMAFRTKNMNAVKLAQHCMSYFINKYATFKPVIEFPAYNKTQVLGANKLEVKGGRKKYWRKKWSVKEAKYILTMREDEDHYEKIAITHRKKADDLADVITQLQAFKILAFLDEMKIDRSRIRLESISAGEGKKFAEIIDEFSNDLANKNK